MSDTHPCSDCDSAGFCEDCPSYRQSKPIARRLTVASPAVEPRPAWSPRLERSCPDCGADLARRQRHCMQCRQKRVHLTDAAAATIRPTRSMTA